MPESLKGDSYRDFNELLLRLPSEAPLMFLSGKSDKESRMAYNNRWEQVNDKYHIMINLFGNLFGGYNAKIIRQYERIVGYINHFEKTISNLTDQEMLQKTEEFKGLLASGRTLDDILPEAFAVVREAARRVLGMRHFDVQMIGGIALHKGQIAEMKTGEGKTLVATAPVYLNALSGKGVHVVTVNDYLAKRDGELMGQVYNFLGLSTGIILSGMDDEQKREAYAADITYGTNHEFGFDYLRDNLKFNVSDMVMRPFNYAVVDEIDSILIDEARTPLIISGADDNASQMYIAVDQVIKRITDDDYEKEEKTKSINLTEQGMQKVEKMLLDAGLISAPLYDPSNVSMVYYVNCALRANKMFRKDVDYMVRDGQVLIIDEFTGRVMNGRRYSEGLHQAIEAKEGVEVQAESQTIASISYQNLFRLYPKLSGMTGTAMTEEAEFDEIYKLKVVSIPPNKPVIRIDHEDSVFLTMAEKDKAVIALIKECAAKRQPVLVGTTSLDRSEYLSELLRKEGIKHNVLNAKQHEREALIISEAGAPGAVTIATNMAGRGTDIKLGGSVETRVALECADIDDPDERNARIEQIKADVAKAHDEVVKLGGLFVIGTERNESRRIDNQLRGRSGRQGDPGESKYFLSLEDDLMRRFFPTGGLAKALQRLGHKQDEALTHRRMTKAIEKAQQRVEAYNFDIRKQLLKYDDVMNEQRKVVYEQRLKMMQSDDISEYVDNIVFDAADSICDSCASQESVPYEWKLDDMEHLFAAIFGIYINKEQIANDASMTHDLFKQTMHDQVANKYAVIKDTVPSDFLKYIQKNVALRALDNAWKRHLLTLEHLRRGINLRSYAQKNPLNEYKFEAFSIFEEMLNSVRNEIVSFLFHLDLSDFVETPEPEPEVISQEPEEDDADSMVDGRSLIGIDSTLVSRNAPCPCGSGMRYKECHGKLPAAEEMNDGRDRLEVDASSIQVPLAHSDNTNPEEIFETLANEQAGALLSKGSGKSSKTDSTEQVGKRRATRVRRAGKSRKTGRDEEPVNRARSRVRGTNGMRRRSVNGDGSPRGENKRKRSVNTKESEKNKRVRRKKENKVDK